MFKWNIYCPGKKDGEEFHDLRGALFGSTHPEK